MVTNHVNNSDIRLAVVGFGGIAQKHIAAFRSFGVKIEAAANRSPEGRRNAEQNGAIERTYADAERMVEDERPDGILVTGSVLSQFRLIQKLIPYDIPLLVEKPPAVRLADWTVLRDEIRRKHLPFMLALNRRYYSVYERALERMGGVDAVTSVSVEWSEDPAKMLALGHPAEMLPLLNFSNSIHGIDLLVFFAGIPVSQEVWGRNLSQSGKDLRWQMSLRCLTDRAVHGNFESNWDIPGRWRLLVDAPDVRMISAPLETAVLFARGRHPETIEPTAEDQQFKPGFYRQASDFLQLIRNRDYWAWPMAGLEEISADMQLAEVLTGACQAPAPANP
jgi:predicted dehydrogenase